MEEELSSSDSDSDELSKEVECELYSVLHHNDFSQGIPPELHEKYNINCNSKGEFAISLKKSTESGYFNKIKEGKTSPLKESRASSTDDVIFVESSSVESTRADPHRTEQVVVEYSDDSSVEMIQVTKKRKLSDSVISLSSTDDENSLSLNTKEEIYESDGHVSDVVQTSSIKWEHVASPSTWTKEMKKYYNSPCNRLRHFNHEKIRQEIRKGTRGSWFISSLDRFPIFQSRTRCGVCREVSHSTNDCPKLIPTCHMCGTEGHSSRECPESICLQCGQRNNKFSSSCGRCHFMRSRECFKCKQFGHESKMCPEKWREFHSTTPFQKTTVANSNPRFLLKQCCNCGSADHSYDQCTREKSTPSSQLFRKRAIPFDFAAGRKAIKGRPPKNRRKKRKQEFNAGRFANAQR